MTNKIYAINGSPRKGFNTDRLLQSYLRGAASIGGGIETEMVYLYDYTYKGCAECMACKLKGGKSYGRCGYPDDIRELLGRVSQSDGIVFGSPVYFFEMSAQLRAFLERLLYPYTQFKKGAPRVIAPKKIHTDFIYTMNVSAEEMEYAGYLRNFAVTENWVSHVFGRPSRRLCACDTYQYRDYSLYEADLWDLERKERTREQQFPKDLELAFQMGRQTVEKILRA